MPSGIYTRTPQMFDKIRGRKHTPEALLKMSKRIPWNKGKTGYKMPPASEERKRKIGLANSIALKGHKASEETKKKLSKILLGNKRGLGYKHTDEAKKIISEKSKKINGTLEARKRSSDRMKGNQHWNWQGGITSKNLSLRNSLEYKLWRGAVFERDNFTCIWCGDKKGGNLEADHIKPFCNYPELRFAIDNGRTLCKPCHRTTDTYGTNAKTK